MRDGVNAIVVEHQGHLRRVILNKRADVSELERLQRLSRELASVSNAIAFASATKGKRANESREQYSVVLDKMPSQPRAAVGTQRAIRSSSSIPELLSMIDLTAGEIHLSNNVDAADQDADRRRPGLGTTIGRKQSLMHSDEMHDTFFDLPSPGEQLAHRQSIGETMDAAKQTMAAKKSMPKKQSVSMDVRRTTTTKVPANVKQRVDDRPITTLMPASAQVSRLPRRAAQPRADDVPKTTSSTKAPPPVTAAAPLPMLVTKDPTVVDSSPSSDVARFETPPAATTAQPPEPTRAPPTFAPPTDATISSSAEEPSTSTAAPATSTPRALNNPPPSPQAHHSYFPNLLAFNPFHLRIPHPSRAGSSDNIDAGDTTTVNPLLAASKALAPPAIATQASPYHHAPEAPLNLFSAQRDDPSVRERAQIVRAAMRMEKRRAVQEAAAMEREARRARRESAAAVAGAAKAKAAGSGKKGWFG